ncbi:hypothetical protein [Bradyrhizobium sp. ORS 285]|uniref:hypothetical protein n=1 Tax=Bradyrhizobium sp. ORS 285 TaxID=115808 RepID=UPI000300DD2D|nr:hypothetical protein [Bradyrhizobium sp. ORS 285]
MGNYIGFFVRDNLGQVPNQTGSSWSSCPDIIFAGTGNPAPPPLSTYTSPAGYATDYGSTVYTTTPPTPNYTFLRALNTNPAATPQAPITGRAWFYWVESDLALWPQNWNTGSVTVAGSAINYQPITTTANNQVVICNLPFIWTPPPPAAGTHYCGVSWIENNPTATPQNPALGFGAFNTFNDLVNFVLQNPNMGWRNTTDVTSLGYTWTQTTGVTGPSTAPPMFYLGIQCKNMPTDAQLGYTIPGPIPSIATISSNLTPISNPNMLNMVPIYGWPGNAVSSITIYYKQGPTQPQTGANVTVTLIIPGQQLASDTLALLKDAPEHMVLRSTLDFVVNRETLAGVDIAYDIYAAVLGTMTYGF